MLTKIRKKNSSWYNQCRLLVGIWFSCTVMTGIISYTSDLATRREQFRLARDMFRHTPAMKYLDTIRLQADAVIASLCQGKDKHNLYTSLEYYMKTWSRGRNEAERCSAPLQLLL